VIGPQAGPAPDGPAGAASRSWSYLLVPRQPGSWHLPAIEVPYFDPGAGRYRFARASLPELVARPPAAGTAGGGLRAGAGEVGSAPPSRGRGAWSAGDGTLARVLPWVLALPLAALLVVVLARHRRGLDGALPALRGGLEAALREERPRRAAAAIERAWRGFLAETRGLPEAAPPARWPDELRKRGVPGEACRELGRLLEDLHYLRFAPELSATAALARELVERSRRLAREV